jgi:hypothetical protein
MRKRAMEVRSFDNRAAVSRTVSGADRSLALAFAVILGLALVVASFAGALAFAGVNALALHFGGMDCGGEGAGSEDRSGGGGERALGHDLPSLVDTIST